MYQSERLESTVSPSFLLPVAIETRDGAGEGLHVSGLHGKVAHGADVGDALLGHVPHPRHDLLTRPADGLTQNGERTLFLPSVSVFTIIALS